MYFSRHPKGQPQIIIEHSCERGGMERILDDGTIYWFLPYSDKVKKMQPLPKDEVEKIVNETKTMIEEFKNTHK